MSKQPYDNRGRRVPLACPLDNCGTGRLQYEGDGWWRCDGLADPGTTDKPLEACTFSHMDGDEYDALPAPPATDTRG